MKNIDKGVFFPALIVLILVIVPLYVAPEFSNRVINALFSFCTGKMGFLYILASLASFGFLFWLTFSKYSKVKLGRSDEKPQFGNFSWAAMLFTAGVGTSIIILGFLEPIYYVSDPPFYLEPFSRDAYEYAHMYGQFHWGLSAWAFYNPAIIGVAYVLFVKGEKRLCLSSACEPVLGRRARGFWGKLIDIFVVFGIVASISTSLGLGAPVLGSAISYVFSIPQQYDILVQIAVLLIWMCIFGGSVYLGLEKGIKNLSNFNIVLALFFMALVLLAGPTIEIIQMEINSLGLYAQNFFRMSTWMDPFGTSTFVEDWTIFYWGWWVAFMPMMGIFVARISRGRTIRNVVWGQMLWGTLGCASSFAIFGGYSLYLQKNGILDVATILNTQGQSAAILAILQTLPMEKFVIFAVCVLCFIYLATTIDSCAFVVAGTTTLSLAGNEEPARWNRLVWAVIFCALSIGLMLIGGLRAVQTISIIAGLPLILVLFLLMASVYKMLRARDGNLAADASAKHKEEKNG